MDDRYLSLGLAGLASADEPFMAHFGAALLAAWWLANDAELAPDTSNAMARQADALIAKHAWLFAERAPATAVDRGDEIADAIGGGLDHTWAIGHDVIYAALVLRTLAQRPELAADWIIDGVLTVLKSCHAQPLETFGGVFDVRGADAAEVDETEVESGPQVADLALRTMLAFDHVYVGLHQGDIGHIPDHAHALLTLERLGYWDTAQRGLRGFREHVAAARRVCHLSADLPQPHDVLRVDPREIGYWEQASASNDWAVGHVFKYPYAILDLLNTAGDPTLESPVLARLGQLIARSL